MAAISATAWSLLSAGDRVVIDRVLYGNSFAFYTRGLTRFGVSVEAADLTDPTDLERALLTAPKFVYFETPANPNLRLIDIAAVAAAAHAAGARVIVDNTFATPVLQRPIELGADLVVHSATKFLGGHGDLLAGVVVGPAADIAHIRGHGLRYLTGATMAPLTAFLLLKTLELRVARHSSSAALVAETLEAHPAVERVHDPGLASSPFHPLARRQMHGLGGLVACELRGGTEAGRRFMNRLAPGTPGSQPGRRRNPGATPGNHDPRRLYRRGTPPPRHRRRADPALDRPGDAGRYRRGPDPGTRRRGCPNKNRISKKVRPGALPLDPARGQWPP